MHEERPPFQQEAKAIDPKVLTTAMGGIDKPPEEPLFSTFEEGFGYFTATAVGRALGQYEFVRKLGWAASSSVWLALDHSAKTKTFVAIKILTSQATANIVAGYSPEYNVFRKIEYTNPKSPGFNHCLTLRACLTTNSAAGSHICFVTDALSSSLGNLRKSGQNRFTLPIAKRIIKQVLLALDYLHRECGYIHTDLKSENILVSIPEPASSRIEEYIKANPPSIYGPPLNLKSLPLPLVFSRSQHLPYLSLNGSIEDISVRLVDYGEATSIDDPVREHLPQPSILRAPEVTLRYPWTSTIDIWTVGCLLFELLTERQLFYQKANNYSHELHLQYIVECLGPFPPEFLKDCEERGKYFDEKGMLLHTNKFMPTTLEVILRRLKAVDEDEIPGTAAFLHRCLSLDPKLRPSAQELLKDSWLL
ncbi:kinase-like domain-containing protein [Amanita rubescens]|nr:kinase-like domain-containing protein [Amanita rubescens]